MIQLVVESNCLPAKTYSFDKDHIVIGREGSSLVDIPIPDQNLAENHITISKNENKGVLAYSVINTNHDPFCSFNDVPFGKRRIQVGDVITVGPSSIKCTQINLPQEIREEPKLSQEISATILQIKPETADAPQELAQKNLLETVKTLAAPEPPKLLTVPKAAPPDMHETVTEAFLKGPKLSIKDDYLREYDDDSESNPFKKRERGINDYNTFLHAPKSWPMVGKLLAASLGVFIVILGVFYMNIRSASNAEELVAAKGVSDVAMALAYAQVRHIHPQSHNWSEPEFIKNNIMAVLAPGHTPLADFDTHGQFSGCPYMLRIYTGSDLNHFIVIAQPAPSVLQWLIPKSSIVINSSSMDIRKIQDLKTINRLLVNSSSIEDKEDHELMALIAKGELIPLHDLVSKAENQGFSPPKTLAMMHPGAENYVYNAPRYFPLGEDIINQIIAIFEKPSSNHEILLVQQELNALQRFPHLLLYTSKGIGHARQAQKALTLMAPNEKFLLAYTQVNSKGKINNAHILIDEYSDGPKDDAQMDDIAYEVINKAKIGSLSDEKSLDKPFKIEGSEGRESLYTEESSKIPPAILSDPFLLQLNALIASRSLILKPVSEDIHHLIASHTQNWTPQYAALYNKAHTKFNRIDEEQKEKITKALGSFIHEHKHLPASRFMDHVATARATPYFQGFLEGVKAKSGPIEDVKGAIERLFQGITTSMSWSTLEQSVAKASDILNFEMVPDPALLIQYQNELGSKVIQKLNQLLLSSDQSLSSEAFTAESHDALARILELAWIEDPDTQMFYLSEFDMHRR